MNTNRQNIILNTDAYKATHWKMYPKNTTKVYSYLESRGNNDGIKSSVFFGLQAFIERYLKGVVVEQWMIEDAAAFYKNVFGTPDYFNRAGWQYIIDVHGGRLPLMIKAVPEGTVVPLKNVLCTVENTDPQCPWLVGHIETLLMQLWYPQTVATISREFKRIVKKYCEQTGCEVSLFHLNDFGYRGVSSNESAAIGGAAHLINFLGSDTLAGIQYVNDYYAGDGKFGFSVAATEHSTTTIFGQENECAAYTHFLDRFPTGLLSVVSDSYDIVGAIKMFGTTLKDRILAREGKFVVRPDSGDPAAMCVTVLTELEKYFGTTKNSVGYKDLPPQIGVIYGDGIDITSVGGICEAVVNAGFSMNNVVFGMGGGLLQKCDRDTLKFAFKCSSAVIDGKRVDVYKDPVTDKGKRSKRGELKLVHTRFDDRFDGGEPRYETVPVDDYRADILEPVFLDGSTFRFQRFEAIRENAKL